MIDQTSQFFAILTNVGAAKQANADALGVPWKITEMGVGDANGTDPTPSAAQTSLINEWRRRPLNQLFVDPVNPAVIVAEQVIPADEGGYWIREMGLYDADGDLVAVANCPPSFKPIMSQGSGRTQVVRMNFIVSSTGNITLKIDPSVVLATREFVEKRILEELYKLDNKQSVRAATTANIALTGLQTIDGVSLLAGDRVLVKNQTASKDNGIYIVGVAAWQRAPDADSSAEVTSALLLSVEQGATLADTRWQLITDGTIILGTTPLTFQNVTQGFAPLNSPALIGTPTAPTVVGTDNSNQIATSAAVRLIMAQFGLGSSAFNYAGNIDTIALTGVYMVTLTTSGTKPLNPGTTSVIPNGTVFHMERGSSNMATQWWDSLVSNAVPITFMRTRNSAGVWTPWAQMWSELNTPKQASPLDLTAGAMLTVGAFGAGRGVLNPDVDLNNYLIPGNYLTPLSGMVNLPPGWSPSVRYSLVVEGYASNNYLVQRITGGLSSGQTPIFAVRVMQNAAEWSPWLVGVTADDSKTSIGTSGYQHFPGGLIRQWGTFSASSLASGAYVSLVITLPKAFPNGLLSGSGTVHNQGLANVQPRPNGSSKTTVTVCVNNQSTIAMPTVMGTWDCWGY
ncbi:phage tail-collar fiber domain-containing protein [Pseudomonas mediterranea]|uniref:phage tail-collar fiber domain-containing protein n=1 Tax=Pseudomonas mediterranea TaxID=183795 RepID=UPI002234C481|nr:phage tail protein [Pseudomonas mediterranea]UZE02161.1 phage tail protein [Pseudomonas mediterranea]